MKPKAEKEGEEGMVEYLDDIIGTTRFFALEKLQYMKKLEEAQPLIDAATEALDVKKKDLEELLALIKNQKKAINKHQK